MLNAVVFIADPQLGALIQRMAGESNEFRIDSFAERGHQGYAVSRTLNTTNPDVILLEMNDIDRDLPVADTLRQQAPNIPLVGLASREIKLMLDRGAKSDLTLAVWPFTVTELEHAINLAVHKVHGVVLENLVAFLPGKAGSGASTVVFHTARVIAQELKRTVLVMEADLHSGLLSSMLNVEPKISIRELLAMTPRVDSLSWPRSVTSVGGVDFLLTNTAIKEPIPSWAHYFQILRFVAPRYDLVMVDLPEVVNPATAEVVLRARSVYVVSTPELASLNLSKQRYQELGHWGVDHDRIQMLLNRLHKSDMAPKDAEKILECPVAATFPNDYKTVRRAITDSGTIDKRSDLADAYRVFARILTGQEAEKKSFSGLFRR